MPRTSTSKGVVYFCNEDEGSGRSFDLPLRSSGWLIELVSLRDALSQRSGAELGCLLVVTATPHRTATLISRELKGRGDDIPVVLVATKNPSTEVIEAMRQGVFYVLTPPLDARRLETTIDSAIYEHAQRRKRRAKVGAIRELLAGMTSAQRELVGWICDHVDGDGRTVTPSVPPPESSALDEVVVGLPRRLRQTLELLLKGFSEKQVAANLHLSRHTIHDYVKVLHRRFQVRSRAELLSKCLQRDFAQMLPMERDTDSESIVA